MGKTVTELVSESDKFEISAGVDFKNDLTALYPIHSYISDVKSKCDVIIDFSHPSLLNDILKYAVDNSIPAVIATTGNSADDIKKIESASAYIPIFFSYNMSIGISLLTELIKKAKNVLGNDFDIEIVEKHHNKKIDAPSGTALMLADALSNNEYEYVYDRHLTRHVRSKNEIGISSVRGGTIVGEHSVIFAGNDEVLEFKHTAYSKKIFASGALNAASWLTNRTSGLYSMKDIM